MKHALTMIALGALAAGASANLLAYHSVNTPGSLDPSFVADGITATTLSRGPGLLYDDDWPTYASIGLDSLNLEQARTKGDYLSFAFTVDAGHEATLTTMGLRYDRNLHGPLNAGVYVSLDGFATEALVHAGTLETTAGETHTGIDLSFLGSGITGTVEFRIYLYGLTDWTLASFDIENAPELGGNALVIDGTVAALAVVPAPAACGLGLAGLGGLAARRRRA